MVCLSPSSQVALVTGASSGIGDATVRKLVASGVTVYAGGRRVERMAPLAAPFGGWYHATKFALEGLSDCLRLELAPFGIATG